MAALLKRCGSLVPSCAISAAAAITRKPRLPYISVYALVVGRKRLTKRSRIHSSSPGNGSSGVSPARPLMDLHLYNTMSRKKEIFTPKVPGKIGMYVCGVTTYDLSHIGHARVYVTFDVIYRYLNHLGYQVCYVRNFTDVDDKDS